MKICGIYKITSPTNKIYIGQSVNIKNRWYFHNKYSYKEQSRIANSIQKHGYENHKFEIIEECSRDLLNEKEVYWIKFYDTFDTEHGMNLRIGGDSPIMSEETRKKMGKSQIGNKKGLGTVRSEETKEKLRIVNTGKKMSEESKLKMSFVRKGKKLSKETKLKMSLAKIGNKNTLGRTLSEEHKTKLRIAHKGKVVSKETRLKLSMANRGKPESIKKSVETRARNRKLRLESQI